MLGKENMDIDPLPIALAKAGYDVWLGNSRGTRFSFKHEKLDWETDEADYWDFSFPELGIYDLPAALSMIKEKTGGKKIRYYGFSLGSTQMFYAMQHPKTKQFMQETLHQFVAAGPIYIPNMNYYLDLNLANYELIKLLLNQTGLQN